VTVHVKREIEKLKTKLLGLCANIEKNLCMAVESIQKRDAALAGKVIDGDIETDHMEVDIEEECLKILALHQPVAIDLRFIITALKINNDLERIGDLAVNIAERAAFLAENPAIDIASDFVDMADKVQAMLTDSLDALVELNVELAYSVCAADDEIDELNRRAHLEVQEAIQNNPDQIAPMIHLLSVSRHLERIADHATNIAEDVIYMVQGTIVRHKAQEHKD
jgi:phosphate transport system protein